MLDISIVSYTNTIPFLYGINSKFLHESLNLSLDYPSICANKILNNQVDIGLVPVTVLNRSPKIKIVTDYCISAKDEVWTVCLFSDVPIEEIKKIYLDYQSNTSVALLKILLKDYWNINPELITANPGYESSIKAEVAGLVIGDRVFELEKKYFFKYDLSYFWHKMTGLPFVFAVWASNTDISKDAMIDFNASLKYGVENINQAIDSQYKGDYDKLLISRYLNKKISYNLDDEKIKAMNLFLDKTQDSI